MVRTLIIDDELKAINVLSILLEKEFSQQLKIEKALGAEEGLEKISMYQPELIFLDIEMPIMNAFELLTKVKERNFTIIFTTAFDQYAIKAIKFNALDYLLKPINSIELSESVSKFLNRTTKSTNKETYNRQLENFLSKKDKSLAVPTQEGVEFLEINTIIRCEAQGNYTNFVLTNGFFFLSSKTLKEYEDLLAQHTNFIRVHRSHLVNIHFVTGYKNEGSLVLKDNSLIPVSRRRKQELVEILKFL